MRLRARLAAIAVAAAAPSIGCSASSAPPGTANDAPTDSTVADVAPTTAPAPSASAPRFTRTRPSSSPEDVFAYLPAACPRMRMYGNYAALAGSALKPAIDDHITRALGRLGHAHNPDPSDPSAANHDAAKPGAVAKILSASNLVGALRGIAVCVSTDNVVAFDFDPGVLRGNLVDVVVSIVSATGSPPVTTTEDGAVVLKPDDTSNGVGVVVGSVLLVSPSVDVVKAGIHARAGAAGFAGANANVVWFTGESGVAGTANPDGADWVLKASGPPSIVRAKNAPEAAKALQQALDQIGPKLDEKLKGFAALVKAVKFGDDGVNWTAELRASTDALTSIVRAAQSTDADGAGAF